MQITLLAAVSADGFIADAAGNGNFSSPEDKAHLRSYLNSNECDCFICGRKTAEEFQDKLTFKPLLVFTHHKQENEANRIYFSTPDELSDILNQNGLCAPALLGGAETYSFFLKNRYVDRVILTTEQLTFNSGKGFDFQQFKDDFLVQKKISLSDQTTVSFYQRKKPRN